MSDKQSETFLSSFLGGFNSYAHLLRFCIAVAFILGLVAFVTWIVVTNLPSAQRLAISFNDEGATIISIDNQPSKALVLLPASKLWTNTGLIIRPGQKISIAATGFVNLAIHRLVDAANNDDRPRHGWVGPEGAAEGDLRNERPVDRLRKPLRIEPKVGFGCLLAYIRPEGKPDPGRENPRPEGIHVFNKQSSELTYKDSEDRVGTLFLTVNDGILRDDRESEEAYVTNQDALDATYGKGKRTVQELRETWKKLVVQNYWDIWFDDNVGEFLVQLSYE